MKLILASGSPRRSEILKNAGYEFVVKPTSADESLPGGILPEDAVKLLSERKADAAKIECSDVVLSEQPCLRCQLVQLHQVNPEKVVELSWILLFVLRQVAELVAVVEILPV